MTQYYVNAAGDNTTGLSPSTAWQNIAKVNAQTLVASDIVSFVGGGTFNDAALVAKSGVLYNSYGTGQASLQFGSTIVILTAVNNVTISNLNLTLTGTALGSVIGSNNTVGVTSGCTNISIQNCTVDGGVVTRQAYSSSTFTSIGIAAVRPDPITPANRQGWDTGWQIIGNTIQNTGDAGISVCGYGHTIDSNTITNVGNNTSLGSAVKYGIVLRGSNCIVKSNSITNPAQGGISSRYSNQDIYLNSIDGAAVGIQILLEDFWNSYSSGTTLIHENKIHLPVSNGIIYASTDNTKSGVSVSFEDLVIYNNVIDSTSATCVGMELKAEGPGTGTTYTMPVNITIKNNALIGTAYSAAIRLFPPASGKTLAVDYNIYQIVGGAQFNFNNNKTNFTPYKTASSQDAHSSGGTDPLFSSFPSYVPATGSIAINAGTPNVHRYAFIAQNPTNLGRSFVLVGRPISYTLPTTTTVSIAANDSQGLVTALAGITAKNILIANGTYTTVGTTAASNGYFTVGAAHKIYASNLLQATLTSGLSIGNNIQNVEVHGLKFLITDGTQVFRPGSGLEGGVIHQWATSQDNSGLKVQDCVIDCGGVCEFGVYSPNPNNLVVERNVIRNGNDTGIFASDMVYASTAIISSIADNVISGFYSRTIQTIVGGATVARGSFNGTGEAGMWIGHKVLNGVLRNKISDIGWMGVWGGNRFINTTVDSLDVDLVYGTVPASSPTAYSGQACYWEHGTTGGHPAPGVENVTIQNSTFGPNLITGWAHEQNFTVAGHQASNNNTAIRTIFDVNDFTHGDKTVGIFLDEGTTNPTVTHCVFRNMRYACIVDLTNEPPATSIGTSSLTQNNNDFTQRGTRAPTGTAATVTYTHPNNSA